MSLETILSILVLASSAINTLISFSVKLGIANMKIWAMERFITKEDHIAVLRAAITTKEPSK